MKARPRPVQPQLLFRRTERDQEESGFRLADAPDQRLVLRRVRLEGDPAIVPAHDACAQPRRQKSRRFFSSPLAAAEQVDPPASRCSPLQQRKHEIGAGNLFRQRRSQ